MHAVVTYFNSTNDFFLFLQPFASFTTDHSIPSIEIQNERKAPIYQNPKDKEMHTGFFMRSCKKHPLRNQKSKRQGKEMGEGSKVGACGRLPASTQALGETADLKTQETARPTHYNGQKVREHRVPLKVLQLGGGTPKNNSQTP